jgi:hypothetical protein
MAARADHGNLASFNELTGRWFGVAKTAVPNETVEVSWAPDGSVLLYALQTPEGKRLMKIDPARCTAEAAVEGAPEFKNFRAGEKGGIFLETSEGWRKAEGNRLSEAEPPEGPPRREGRRRPRRDDEERGGNRQHVSWKSPDGRWEVTLREGTVMLKDTKDGKERELAKKDDAGEFRGEPVWAPDSTRFAMWKEKDVEERIVHYIESSPKDQLQPKHFTREYPKPGDVIDTRAPWVFFTGNEEAIATDEALIANPFECNRLEWRKDSKRLSFEFVERGFGKHNLIEIDSATRKQRVLVREESDTFVFVYGNSFRRDLNDGDEILWMSERDGWKHLYLLNGSDGASGSCARWWMWMSRTARCF